MLFSIVFNNERNQSTFPRNKWFLTDLGMSFSLRHEIYSILKQLKSNNTPKAGTYMTSASFDIFLSSKCRFRYDSCLIFDKSLYLSHFLCNL